jgi:protease-4
VKSVLLLVDSPGGSATDSGHLQSAIAKLAETKPIVAFVQGVAASGAYMAASPATKIVALPSALVGSIGVISVMPILRGLLDRLGINIEVVKSGRLKDMGLFHREPTDEERKKEQDLSDEIYNEFVDSVAKYRKLGNEQVKSLATGEIFTAKKALQLGLIDELGDQDRAIELASELGNVPKRIVFQRPRRGLLQRLFPWGAASTIFNEAYAGLEDRFLRELTIQVRT